MVMLVSANAKRLMFGYLLGAYLTAIVSGLVVVFALPDSGAVNTTQNALSPALDFAFGAIAIIVGIVLLSERGTTGAGNWRERRRQKQAEKKPPRWRRALDRGSPRVAFAVGAALSFPGASYLIALDLLHNEDLSTAATVICVIAFVVIELILLELPILGFTFAPERTVAAIDRFRSWVASDARRFAARAAIFIGALLLIRGAIELL